MAFRESKRRTTVRRQSIIWTNGVSWTIRNNRQCIFFIKIEFSISIEEIAFENDVWEMATMMFKVKYIDGARYISEIDIGVWYIQWDKINGDRLKCS